MEEAKAPHAYAVLIGAGKYSDAAIQSRPHAEDDVKALYDLFTDKAYLGVPKDHVKLLLGGTQDEERKSQEATQDNILKAAQWVAKEAKRDDLVIFAFIGQGAALGEHADRFAYFATDSDVKDPAKTAVLASALGEDLDKLQSRRVCLFVDVYFKGYKPVNGSSPADPNTSAANFFKEFLGKDSGEEEVAAPGRVLFLASGNGRFLSPDGEKHGTFTQVLLDGLKGKADKEGYEPDGVVTVDELAEYVKASCPPWSSKHVANEKKRPSYAVYFGEDAHIVLTHNPAVEAKRQAAARQVRQPGQGQQKLTAEIVQEGQDAAQSDAEARFAAQPPQGVPGAGRRQGGGRQVPRKPHENPDGDEAGPTRRPASSPRRSSTPSISSRTSTSRMSTEGQLVDWAVRGLYRSLDEKVPDDVAKKLDSVKTMKNPNDRDLRTLLTDVRERLGKREDLDNHKDIDDTLLRMLRHLDPYTTFYTPDELRHARRTCRASSSASASRSARTPTPTSCRSSRRSTAARPSRPASRPATSSPPSRAWWTTTATRWTSRRSSRPRA